VVSPWLQYFRSQRCDLEESAVAEFAADGPEHARAARVEVVLIALMITQALSSNLMTNRRTAHRLRGANDHGLDDLAFLPAAPGIADFTVPTMMSPTKAY